MNYYVKERTESGENAMTAFSKARADAEEICRAEGYETLTVWTDGGDVSDAGLGAKLLGHVRRRTDWKRALEPLREGDTLFLQLPILYNCVFLAGLLKRLRRRGVRVTALVHDLETVRLCLTGSVPRRTRLRMRLEETGVMRLCDTLVVHNERMASLLEGQGLSRERMRPLGIFDYLMGPETERAVRERKPSPERTLIVAGNLDPEKAGYVYDVPDGIELDLYGVRFADPGKPGLHHHGAFSPEELPGRLRGGFGLVWDGPSAEGCAGVYGEYLRVNNPHKTSLYLASGLPVAIWEEAALAELVRRERVGITAPSVAEAARLADALPEAEYSELCENAARLGEKLRAGEFLRRALSDCAAR